MLKFNSVAVTSVRCLEVGDLIAREFLGGVVAGKITGIAHYAFQLTDGQRKYLIQQGVEVPGDDHTPLGGPSSCVIFVDTSVASAVAGRSVMNHMFVDYNVNVAVFPPEK